MRRYRSNPRLFRERLLIFVIIFTIATIYMKDDLPLGSWSFLATLVLALEILLW